MANTSTVYPRKAYGQWAGDPKGVPYDAARCAWEVWSARYHKGMIGHQCRRRPVAGSLYCRQHIARGEWSL